MTRGGNRGALELSRALRVGIGLFGLATFAVGVIAVFATTNGAGAAALLAIGAACGGLAVLGDRVQSVTIGGATLTLRDLARQAFALAGEAELRGEHALAEELRAAGNELQDLARAYRRVRGSMRAGDERTNVMERVIDETRELSLSDAFEAIDVSKWFDEGTPEARITALGLMQGNPRLRDFDAALDAIEASQSAFEQYHGLLLGEMMVKELSGRQRAQLAVAVEGALGSFRVRRDGDRNRSATRILQALRIDGDA